MTLSGYGTRKLKVWINLLREQGWSIEDQKFLIDYWMEHHDEDGIVIAKGHPLYVTPGDNGGSMK